MATSIRKVKATVSKSATKAKKPVEKTATAAKAQASATDIINQFSQLPAAERAKLHRDLQDAVNRDTNLISMGREADGSGYQEIIDRYNQEHA